MNENHQQDLYKEMHSLKEIGDHPNIVKLLGTVLNIPGKSYILNYLIEDSQDFLLSKFVMAALILNYLSITYLVLVTLNIPCLVTICTVFVTVNNVWLGMIMPFATAHLEISHSTLVIHIYYILGKYLLLPGGTL